MKMYHVLVLITFLFAAVSVEARDTLYYGVKKDVPAFDRISLFGFYDVIVDGSKAESALFIRNPQLEVAPEVLVHNVFEPVVTDSELQIAGMRLADGSPTPFRIHHNALKQISCSAEGKALAENLQVVVMKVVASGNCQLTLQGQIESLRAEVSGNAIVDISQAQVKGVSQSTSGNGKLIRKND